MSFIVRVAQWLIGLFLKQDATIATQEQEIEILEAQRDIAERPLPSDHDTAHRMRERANAARRQ